MDYALLEVPARRHRARRRHRRGLSRLGRRHIEYLAYRGVFVDIPFDEIRGAFGHHFPHMTRQQEDMSLGGDFGAEGALGANDQGRK